MRPGQRDHSKRLLIRPGLVALMAAACQPVPTLRTGSTASPIVGGTQDSGDPAIMYLYIEGTNVVAICTAELVAPTVLVTAAHCVGGSTDVLTPTYAIYPDANPGFPPSAGATRLEVLSTSFDPLFDVNNLEAGHDIGVAILAAPAGVPPLPILTTPLSPAVAGQPVRLVGYGATDNGATRGGGMKFQVTALVDDISDVVLHIGNSSAQICEGDSGGAALMTIDGVETLVGVASYVGGTTMQPCLDGGYSTRLDVYGDFLTPYLQPSCTPECTGKACGPDGCGGVCGTCPDSEACSEAGLCFAPAPTPIDGGAQGSGGTGTGPQVEGSYPPPMAMGSPGGGPPMAGNQPGTTPRGSTPPAGRGSPVGGSGQSQNGSAGASNAGYRGPPGGSGCACVRPVADAPRGPAFVTLGALLGLVTAVRRTATVKRR